MIEYRYSNKFKSPTEMFFYNFSVGKLIILLVVFSVVGIVEFLKFNSLTYSVSSFILVILIILFRFFKTKKEYNYILKIKDDMIEVETSCKENISVYFNEINKVIYVKKTNELIVVYKKKRVLDLIFYSPESELIEKFKNKSFPYYEYENQWG